MVDLSQGSDTRILAGKIKKFLEDEKNQLESDKFFSESQAAHLQIRQEFEKLTKDSDSYNIKDMK